MHKFIIIERHKGFNFDFVNWNLIEDLPFAIRGRVVQMALDKQIRRTIPLRRPRHHYPTMRIKN
jgi:hypothetical protein